MLTAHLSATEKGTGSRLKDKNQSAEMSDLACEEEPRGSLAHVFRLESSHAPKVTNMVQGHQHHYDTPQDIDRMNTL